MKYTNSEDPHINYAAALVLFVQFKEHPEAAKFVIRTRGIHKGNVGIFSL
jgi:hypothetical protein